MENANEGSTKHTLSTVYEIEKGFTELGEFKLVYYRSTL